LRLYPHNELDASGVLQELCRQASLGLGGGFDGVMTSEHHGGFAGYLPNPLQVTSFILEENDVGWAAPCPLLLPLRATAQVAEEIAWLDARHPGRVGLGVAVGALPLDFDAMEVPFAEAVPRFKAALPRVVDLLRGRDLGELEGDRALQRCATSPVPVLSAAMSTAAARRAARCGAGILTEGLSAPERLATLCQAYDEAGGTGTKVVVRRVWLGELKSAEVAQQRAVYQSYAPATTPFGADQTLHTTDPSELAERCADLVRQVGADALNLRIHLPGIAPSEIREQISALVQEVLPQIRRLQRPHLP
jgi:alkanesulfonate monooxygenase SsuD/methylene tetrahydromethanopterin reductase-like flavin-dependent oxidoreductase (luciferase family)